MSVVSGVAIKDRILLLSSARRYSRVGLLGTLQVRRLPTSGKHVSETTLASELFPYSAGPTSVKSRTVLQFSERSAAYFPVRRPMRSVPAGLAPSSRPLTSRGADQVTALRRRFARGGTARLPRHGRLPVLFLYVGGATGRVLDFSDQQVVGSNPTRGKAA